MDKIILDKFFWFTRTFSLVTNIIFCRTSYFCADLFVTCSELLSTVDDAAVWKVSKYGVFSDPYFPVFGLNTGKYGPEKLRIWTVFTQNAVERGTLKWNRSVLLNDAVFKSCFLSRWLFMGKPGDMPLITT